MGNHCAFKCRQIVKEYKLREQDEVELNSKDRLPQSF